MVEIVSPFDTVVCGGFATLCRAVSRHTLCHVSLIGVLKCLDGGEEVSECTRGYQSVSMTVCHY